MPRVENLFTDVDVSARLTTSASHDDGTNHLRTLRITLSTAGVGKLKLPITQKKYAMAQVMAQNGTANGIYGVTPDSLRSVS